LARRSEASWLTRLKVVAFGAERVRKYVDGILLDKYEQEVRDRELC
jgi:hypothetical protein